jgi:hypothetical protein
LEIAPRCKGAPTGLTINYLSLAHKVTTPQPIASTTALEDHSYRDAHLADPSRLQLAPAMALLEMAPAMEATKATRWHGNHKSLSVTIDTRTHNNNNNNNNNNNTIIMINNNNSDDKDKHKEK